MQYLKLMRVKHYIKNLLIVLPLFFSGLILDSNKLFRVLIGFLIFSLVASCVYILNDIVDVEKDRTHSTKRFRPIASGAVSVGQAYLLLVLFFIIVLSLSIFVLHDVKFLILPICYLILNIAYSYGLKNIPVVDVFVISLGFLLRLFYGGILISEVVSNWLFLTVLFGTLFLGFGKRRNELLKEKTGTRKALEKYSSEFLSSALNMCMALTLTFYSLWTIETDPEGKLTLYTVPLIALLAFKYYYSLNNANSGDPTDIFYQEKWIPVSIIILIVVFSKALYF